MEELSSIDQLLKEEFIKPLLTGIDLENKSSSFYLKVYNFISHYSNKDEEASNHYNYYKKIIEDFSKELAKELNDISNNEIIGIFIDIANRMNILISFMSKTFAYVDFFFVKSKNLKKVLECAFEIYKNNIFLPVQKQLIDEVNKLIQKDRNGKKKIV